jgi:hypothetical protein
MPEQMGLGTVFVRSGLALTLLTICDAGYSVKVKNARYFFML